MYKLLISACARNDLKKLKQTYQGAIVSALEEIREDPFVGKPLTRELSGRFSFRVGAYRIIYRIRAKDKVVHIITAGHRSTIYH